MTAEAIPINEEIANLIENPTTSNKGSAETRAPKSEDIYKKPQMPSRLKGNEYAETEWKWVADKLERDGNILLIYRTALMFHCINVSLLMKAHDRLVEKESSLKEGESVMTAKTPNDYEQISADLINYYRFSALVRKGFDDFGMSPKARIKLVRDPNQLALPLT